MKENEIFRCIQKLNPKAQIRLTNGEIFFNDTHQGVKPTLKDCESVLKEVQKEMAAEQLTIDNIEELKKIDIESIRYIREIILSVIKDDYNLKVQVEDSYDNLDALNEMALKILKK